MFEIFVKSTLQVNSHTCTSLWQTHVVTKETNSYNGRIAMPTSSCIEIHLN